MQEQLQQSLQRIRIDCLDDENFLRTFSGNDEKHFKSSLEPLYGELLGKDNLRPLYNEILLVPGHFTNFYFNFVEHFNKYRDRVHQCNYFKIVSCKDYHSGTFLSTLIRTLGNFFSKSKPDNQWRRIRPCRDTTDADFAEHLRIRYFDITKNNCIGQLFQLDSEGCIETFREDFENLLPKDVNMIVHKRDAHFYLPLSYLCLCSLRGLYYILRSLLMKCKPNDAFYAIGPLLINSFPSSIVNNCSQLARGLRVKSSNSSEIFQKFQIFLTFPFCHCKFAILRRNLFLSLK